MIKNTNNNPSLFSSLSDMLNQSHPLYQLADKIDWGKFETAFQPLYCQSNGRPGKPIRLMCGMLILKHLRNLSDESLVEQWSENPCVPGSIPGGTTLNKQNPDFETKSGFFVFLIPMQVKDL